MIHKISFRIIVTTIFILFGYLFLSHNSQFPDDKTSVFAISRKKSKKSRPTPTPTRIPTPTITPTSAPTPTVAINTPTPPQLNGRSYFVNPNGNDISDGLTELTPFKSVQKTVDLAYPGDIINLQDGIYFEDIISKRDGISGNPIIIKGTSNAIIKGGGRARIVEINHDYISLEGFTIDGKFKDEYSASSYRNKLLYILGKQVKEGVNGLVVKNMTFQNAGGECVRLRYFAHDNEISYSSFLNCGIIDFLFNGGGKNGEGLYIGTAPEQLNDGKNPTNDPDRSYNNHVNNNVFNTQGNECVDIKESSVDNIIEYNSCTGQKDLNSAGFDSRGNTNTFRNNEIFGNSGAGIRLGGDILTDGTNNNVYDNSIRDNLSGGVKFQRMPQGKICGNVMTNNTSGNSVGTYGSLFDPTVPCL